MRGFWGTVRNSAVECEVLHGQDGGRGEGRSGSDHKRLFCHTRGSDLYLQAVGVSAIETSGCVTRKIDMVTVEDGQVGWNVSFLSDSLPKLGIFGFQQ